MPKIWTPGQLQCRVCSRTWPGHRRSAFLAHLSDCVERHADYIDQFRPKEPFEGDPELGLFAREEGSVYDRRPGTRRQPR